MRNRLSSSPSRWALLALLLIGVPAWAQVAGPPLVCSVSVPNPQNLRGTGQSELVADILISCANGTPAFQLVPTVTVLATFNTNLTNRILSNTGLYAPYLDAVLLVDDPAPASQLMCVSTDNTCTILSSGNPTQTYDGTTGHPNVFQGVQATQPTTLVFPNVPLDPAGANNVRTLRIKNVRLNATGLTAGSTATVSINVTNTTMGTSTATLGTVQGGGSLTSSNVTSGEIGRAHV